MLCRNTSPIITSNIPGPEPLRPKSEKLRNGHPQMPRQNGRNQ
ncbi:hypothetical protein TNCT_304431, partial [Trichonephila clavata]